MRHVCLPTENAEPMADLVARTAHPSQRKDVAAGVRNTGEGSRLPGRAALGNAPTFETARLTLRPFTSDDVDALATVFDDKEAMWDVLAIPGTARRGP